MGIFNGFLDINGDGQVSAAEEFMGFMSFMSFMNEDKEDEKDDFDF